jgi:4-carboxymuconolactone decarboxylase
MSDVRREVLGDEHVDRALASASPFSAPWQDHLSAHAWDAVWARPGLDRRTRSLLTLALLTAQRAETELALHVEAAIRIGVTAEEIRETLMHTAVYAGVPAANAAFAVAQRVLRDLGEPTAVQDAGGGD